MISEPEKTPAAPTPAMARPTISIFEEVAAPQRTLPSSKMKMAARYTSLMGRKE